MALTYCHIWIGRILVVVEINVMYTIVNLTTLRNKIHDRGY